ncbi:MAG: 1-acyl-sn-glycerol-3-phosphate acyltransferase [Methylococcales symbiont of Iophon sp. n. MRB-2018]|nr:MAG: 1-acyl-sn-glycerol-3-phosphate acyltransferase [Methylococcales symbiont of Iophon sp. n. MRB-2018]KAF3980396.1 MAG: 1-acyl-sn-glycerol-3-phosphate acyltransferase [Methylococcales symbiont of Iophon sp. n. MRB-2018]
MTQQNSLSNRNNFRAYFGSTVFFLYILISVPTFCPVMLLALFLPFSVRYNLSVAWAVSVLWIAKVFCGLTHEVEGLENLPKNQTYIVLCKHQSAWETLFTRLFLPKQTAVLKRSLTWMPIGGWILATLKPIAIDREKKRAALRTIVEQGTARLKEGFVVVIFPEGTRVAPGEDKEFSIGGALLAQKSEFPVIPLAHNAGEFWPRYSFFKYPGIIKVKIGPAIDSKGKKAKQINLEASTWIAEAMKEISFS